MAKITGLATGIGSLPYKDPDLAMEIIFKHCPEIPFWPQLPKRDMREGMIAQYSEGLPCLRLEEKGIGFDVTNQDEELAKFYEHIIANDLQHFKISDDFSVGLWQFLSRLETEDLNKIKFIKCHITGPFTFAASINDSYGKPILHDPVFMQAMLEGLACKARWQIKLFQKFNKPVIVFIDEPYLSCLGSAFTAINREDVVAGLSEFTKKIKSCDCLIGVHCCGNTDWSALAEVAGIDIINFDAFNFLERVLLYSRELVDFFNRGAVLAWGIVPTEDFSIDTTATSLSDKLEQGLKLLINKGISEKLVRNQLMITPACGLGAMNVSGVEPIFKTLDSISSVLRS